MIGQRLLHYEIVDKLGEGGMGVVYKARDIHLDRFVAIKVLPPEKVADPARKVRFVQEAKAASALNHPNIITIHDISSENGIDFIAMEFVDGKTLDELIPRKGMRLNEALKIAVQIAGAFSRAHEAGIIHRDLKPANIMVDAHGHVKVLDFGLAKLTEQGDPSEAATATAAVKTEEGTIAGTAAYMSPEQAEGKAVDPRSDIFSFGAVLYEMLAGRRAFQGDSKMSTLAAVIQKEPEALSADVSPDLAKIVTRCLRKDPARRFQHFDDIYVALDELRLDSESGKLPAVPPRRSGNRLWPWLAGVAVLAAGAVAVWQMRVRSVEPGGQLKVQPLTSFLGNESSPSLSPDGTQVAFLWNPPGKAGIDVYVKQIGVDEPFPLTETPELEARPEWSPDGLSIAFVRLLKQSLNVIVVPQRGGPERIVAEFALHEPGLSRFGLYPALCWMPDSKNLVVSAREGEREPNGLWMVSAFTGERRRLIPAPEGGLHDLSPAVSPNGRVVVFSRTAGDTWSELYRQDVSADGKAIGDLVRLPRAADRNTAAAWTPDGSEIVFTAGTDYVSGLWRMEPVAGAHPVRIALPDPFASQPSISLSGSRLAYAAASFDQGIWKLEIDAATGKAGPPVRFSSSTMPEQEPDFSPDGRQVAFMSTRSGSPEIWTCDSGGTRPVQLTSFGGPATNAPRWSPDGRLIAFHSDASGNRDIYVIRPSGGTPKRLTDNPGPDRNVSWAHDGGWIYFTSELNSERKRMRISPAGGAAMVLDGHYGTIGGESADGRFRYVRRGYAEVNTIWLEAVDGSTEQEIVRGIYPWAPFRVTNDGVYYIAAQREDQGFPIRSRRNGSGRTETIAHVPLRPLYGFAVSPDRRTILIPQTGGTKIDLRLVETFR